MAEKFGKERSPAEQEGPVPIISFAESKFIEDTGGKYYGFVDGKNGRRDFEEVWVNREAHYDERERAVVETFISTEGVNNEGGNELQDPSEVEGFSMLIVRRSRLGQEIGKPDIISLRLHDFPGKRMSVDALRRIAHDLHDFVTEEALQLEPLELHRQIEARLQLEGWRAKK